jgi:hypothetical protein
MTGRSVIAIITEFLGPGWEQISRDPDVLREWGRAERQYRHIGLRSFADAPRRWLENSARFQELPVLNAWESGVKVVRAAPADADMLATAEPITLPRQFWTVGHWTIREKPPLIAVRGSSPNPATLVDPEEFNAGGPEAGEKRRRRYGEVRHKLATCSKRLAKELKALEKEHFLAGKERGLQTAQAQLLSREAGCSFSYAKAFLGGRLKDRR